VPTRTGHPTIATLAVLAASWPAQPLFAADGGEEAGAGAMPTVVVTAPRIATDWRSSSLPVSVVTAADQPGERKLAMDEMLQAVPGVYAQDRYNFAQDLRISIRGFGARSTFGTRGIRVLVDDVPLTMPDGQTDLDGIDMALVDGIEVVRGPDSVLYGNGAGGTLLVHLREPDVPQRLWLSAEGGDPDSWSLRGGLEGRGDGIGGLMAFSSTRFDGYREHSTVDTDTLTGKLDVDQVLGGSLRLSANAIDAHRQDPGGLTVAEVAADRNAAAPNNVLYDAGEIVRQQRLTAAWTGLASAQGQMDVRLWGGHRDFSNRLPYASSGQTAFGRDFGGLSVQGLRRGGHWQLVSGVDLARQNDDRTRHDNSIGGISGALTQDETQRATSWGVFVSGSWQFLPLWSLDLGARYDRLRFTADDHFLSDGDDSGQRSVSDPSYSAGLLRQLPFGASAYARISTSFESPTVTELANPAGGGFNPDLKSAKALNRELGLKGETAALRYDLAVYWIDLDRELVSYELDAAPGQTFYRNAASSRRRGAEVSATWQVAANWSAYAAWSWNDYRFEAGNGDLQGRHVPGIPAQQLFAELSTTQLGWTARFNVKAAGRQYADDDNTVAIGGYAIYGLRLSRRWHHGNLTLTPSLGVDNLTDHDVHDNVRINASASRYFEPGPGRVIYGGLKAEF